NHIINVESGTYVIMLAGSDGNVDPFLTAQVQVNETCNNDAWIADDDNGPGALGSALELSVSASGQLLISSTAFSSSAEGAATLTITKR
ncbi:MAG: hypothetical protein AAF386_05260, partial [Pseudomonadota bacterium]